MAEKHESSSIESIPSSDSGEEIKKARVNSATNNNNCTEIAEEEEDDNEDDDDDEENWEPISEEDKANIEEESTCLFCSQTFRNIELAINHVQTDHGVHFGQLKHKFQMNQYDFIQLINCIRRNSLRPEALLTADKPFWKQEEYFAPKNYEPWLCYGMSSQNLLHRSRLYCFTP